MLVREGQYPRERMRLRRRTEEAKGTPVYRKKSTKLQIAVRLTEEEYAALKEEALLTNKTVAGLAKHFIVAGTRQVWAARRGRASER